MIDENEAREWICEIGHRMHDRGLISGIDGNISIRLSKRRMLVTPSGVNKGFLKPADLIVVDINDGTKVKGRGRPTSEIRMHLEAYKLRPDIGAVVHAHPPTAVALSIANISLSQGLIAEDLLQYGIVPTAPYATPGSEAVPRALAKYIIDHEAVMLARHGSVTVGKDVFEAYNRLESLEHTAKITYMAMRLGKVKPLPDDEIERLIDLAEQMGVKTGWKPLSEELAGMSREEQLISEVLARVLKKLGY